MLYRTEPRGLQETPRGQQYRDIFRRGQVLQAVTEGYISCQRRFFLLSYHYRGKPEVRGLHTEGRDASITGCIRTSGVDCSGTEEPSKRSFHTEYGKGMELYPDSMRLTGGGIGRMGISYWTAV